MTSGTKIDDYRTTYTVFFTNYGSSGTTGPTAFGPEAVGKYATKTWNGFDGPKIVPPLPGKKLRIKTVDRYGRRYTYRARESFSKRSKFRDPHAYDMSMFEKITGLGVHSTKTVRNADPNIWSSHEVSNCSIESLLGNPGLLPLPPWNSNDDNVAIGKLKEKMHGSDFNLGILLGESHKTLEMIGNTAVTLAKAGLLAREGKLAAAAAVLSGAKGNSLGTTKRVRKDVEDMRWLEAARNPDGFGMVKKRVDKKVAYHSDPRRFSQDALASKWLELTYGWKPLLKDIDDGAKMLAHQLVVPFRKRYSVRYTKRTYGTIPTTPTFYQFSEAYASTSQQIVAYVSEPVSLPAYLGLYNLEQVFWELTPFSFVADWVVPFGNYLDARAFASHLTGTFVITTLSRQSTMGLKFFNFTNGVDTVSGQSSHPYYRQRQVSMTRRVSTSLPVRLPEVKTLDKALSWQHCVNGLALLSAVFGGGVNRYGMSRQ